MTDGSGHGERAPFSIVERVRFGDSTPWVTSTTSGLAALATLRFFETARIAFIQEVWPSHSPTQRSEFGFIFAECQIAYRSPAFFGDELRIAIEPSEPGRSSLRLVFRMTCEGDGRLVADGHGTLVGYDYAAGRSQPIPDELRERVSARAPRPVPAAG